MPMPPYMLSAALLGALVAFQPLANAIIARAIGSPYGAAAISIAVAGLGALAMVAVDRPRRPAARHPRRRPLVDLPRRLHRHRLRRRRRRHRPGHRGALFFACVVAGQLGGAMLADHFGWFGVAVRSITLVRLLGFALVLGGAVLVQRG